MKLHVLFVDDEPKILEGLQRMLYSQRQEWNMSFASSGPEALKIMESHPMNVIVTDMRMSGMNGAQLLTEVMKKYSNVVRIVLSGQSDQQMILRSVGPAHRYLSKPCDADTLISTIECVSELRNLLTQESLVNLVSKFDTLPSIPSLYVKVVEELNTPEASVHKVGQIISEDIGMTTKILQLVNSGFFALSRRITNPVQAVTLLGLETIKSLVLAIGVFSKIDERKFTGLSLDKLWAHSMAVGKSSKKIAEAETNDKAFIEDTFMAGLLHDIGKLILSTSVPEDYAECLSSAKIQSVPQWHIEKEMFGATHAEVGAYLIGLWGLPDPIVEAVAYHHRPSQCQSKTFGPLSVVHFVNAAYSTPMDTTPDPAGETSAPGGDPQRETKAESPVDFEYLKKLDLEKRIPVWMSVCGDHSPEKDAE